MDNHEPAQQRWAQLFEKLPENRFCFLVDPDGYFLHIRVPDESRLWIPLEEHYGKRFQDVLPPELLRDRLHFFQKVLETKESQEYSYWHPITKGRHVTCRICPLLKEEDGAVREILIQVFDTLISEIPPIYQ